jgi:hypothetical protein
VAALPPHPDDPDLVTVAYARRPIVITRALFSDFAPGIVFRERVLREMRMAAKDHFVTESGVQAQHPEANRIILLP